MDLSEKFNKELDRIDDLIEQLGVIADSDGTITSDEQAILDRIMNDLSDYRSLVFDVLEDGKITNDEKTQIKEFKERLLENANSTALRDGELSREENKLIDSLIDFVNS